MTIAELIARTERAIQTLLNDRKAKHDELLQLRSDVAARPEGQRELTDEEAVRETEIAGAITQIDGELTTLQSRRSEQLAEQARDKIADDLQRDVNPTGATLPGGPEERLQAADRRTYTESSDRKGKQFLRDVVNQFMFGAAAVDSNERLAAHMREERGERGEALQVAEERAAGTGAFAGLVVPQYLTDMYAPMARAGRPFADACRHHDLPETGMTAQIGRVTTGTSVDTQVNEFDTVSEADVDDTLLTVPIRTAAGSQTISRQGVDRGVGVEDTTTEDLFGAYATNLDTKLINLAAVGLSAIANAISYTDASPTAVELYPKLLQGPAQVEAAMLNQQQLNDNIAVMHSRRWYWLQSQLASVFPMFGTPGVPAQNVGLDYGKQYGAGFRGVLPSGVAVVVDNNIATNKGAGTNEDEIYFGAQSELHLWEDPSAPMLIRAEQSQVKKLAIDLVAYGYFAFTFERRPHTQKIGGTGLVTPAWA